MVGEIFSFLRWSLHSHLPLSVDAEHVTLCPGKPLAPLSFYDLVSSWGHVLCIVLEGTVFRCRPPFSITLLSGIPSSFTRKMCMPSCSESCGNNTLTKTSKEEREALLHVSGHGSLGYFFVCLFQVEIPCVPQSGLEFMTILRLSLPSAGTTGTTHHAQISAWPWISLSFSCSRNRQQGL